MSSSETVQVFEGESIPLTREQADAAEVMRAQGWHRPTWWEGGTQARPTERTPISLEWTRGGPNLRVRGRFGVLRLPGLSVEVLPMTDRFGTHGQSHFERFFRSYRGLPQIAPGYSTELERGQSLLMLVFEAFVSSSEVLLLDDLLKGYSEAEANLPYARGSIRPVSTALAYYSGRLEFDCRFEDFTADIPINRVIKEALRLVLRECHRRRAPSGRLSMRARMLLDLLGEVGPLSHTDVALCEIDRGSLRYETSLELARDIIDAVGRDPKAGAQASISFLFSTSTVFEVGLLRLLRQYLQPLGWQVRKNPIPSRSLEESYNPDFIFTKEGADVALGDAKYKVLEDVMAKSRSTDWRDAMRGDIYEMATFCTAARLDEGALFLFQQAKVGGAPPATPGGLSVGCICWDLSVGPAAAEAQFVAQVQGWLSAIHERNVVLQG